MTPQQSLPREQPALAPRSLGARAETKPLPPGSAASRGSEQGGRRCLLSFARLPLLGQRVGESRRAPARLRQQLRACAAVCVRVYVRVCVRASGCGLCASQEPRSGDIFWRRDAAEVTGRARRLPSLTVTVSLPVSTSWSRITPQTSSRMGKGYKIPSWLPPGKTNVSARKQGCSLCGEWGAGPMSEPQGRYTGPGNSADLLRVVRRQLGRHPWGCWG